MTSLSFFDTMAVLSDRASGEVSVFDGLYFRDTRFISSYAWDFERTRAIARTEPEPGCMTEIFTSEVRDASDWAIRRTVRCRESSVEDTLLLENYAAEPARFAPALSAKADFADMMGLRLMGERYVTPTVLNEGYFSWSAYAKDGIRMSADLTFSLPPCGQDERSARWAIEVAPHSCATLRVTVQFGVSPAHSIARDTENILSFGELKDRFADILEPAAPYAKAANTALRDLYSLVRRADTGPTIAAGLPYFAVPFGRDSLIAANFLLHRWPELAEGVLRFAAASQGTCTDPRRQEEPGKIFHETRPGELSRCGDVPFERYYGSADATPLFLMLLERYTREVNRPCLVRDLESSWRAALSWLLQKLREGNGFVRFRADAGAHGLKVQSWKDSPDSMCFMDGSLAVSPIAVSEIQAYAYGALCASGRMALAVGDGALAALCDREAGALGVRIRESFWLPSQRLYALALDGEDRVLDTPSSNAGHFLAFRLESEADAGALAQRLLEPDLFSGWGIRTLSDKAGRYNPLSYHNGSVWPHDNALIAEAMLERGFRGEAFKVCDSMLTAISTFENAHAPELFAGYSKADVGQPVRYPFACAPQAWSAAAVLRLCDIAAACQN